MKKTNIFFKTLTLLVAILCCTNSFGQNCPPNDQVPPEIHCPSNITTVNNPGQCKANVPWVQPTVTDNCPMPSSPSSNYQSGDEFEVGITTTVTYNVTDASGNSASCNFTITVNDTEKPIFSNCPQNITVSNDPGQCEAIVSWTAPEATDNCTMSLDVMSTHMSNSVFLLGTTQVTYSTMDEAMNTGMCQFSVTVNDTEVPVLTCPQNITTSNETGQCGAIVDFMATASDNCPMVGSPTASPASGSFFDVGTTEVTFSVIDHAGNPNSCSFNVTVNDTENPVLTCPQNITTSNEAGQCGAIVNFMATASDNCPMVGTPIASPASGSFFDVGTTAVTFSVIDHAGNPNSCSFNVTVNDTENPVLTCPQNITTSNDAGQCGAIVNFMATVSDNCPMIGTPTASPASGSFFDVGTTAVTFSVIDHADNPATCSFNVTVNDTENPVLTCPQNITTSNDAGQCGAVVDFMATISDNCPMVGTPIASPASGSFFDVGTTAVTFSVIDHADNPATCSFNVTVNDTENPVLTCPNDILVSNDVEVCGAIVTFETPIAMDNCPIIDIPTALPVSGTFFELGTTEVTFSVMDHANNPATCFFNVTVNDTEAPRFITCPSGMVVDNEFGECGAIVTFGTPTVTDNCGIAAVVSDIPSGTFFEVGATLVTFSISDVNGNVNDDCQIYIEVIDNEAPIIFECPAPITAIAAEPFGCSTIINLDGLPIFASDNCGFTVSHDSETNLFEVGTTDVTWTVTDDAGNSDDCHQKVTVVDVIAPEVTCPEDINVTTISDNCFTSNVDLGAPFATDNCGIVSISSNAPENFPVGTTNVAWTIVDSGHNAVTCFQKVSIEIGEPMINCPSSQAVSLPSGELGANVSWTAPILDAACELRLSSTHQSGDFFLHGTTSVSYYIYNIEGDLLEECSFDIVVYDPLIIACFPSIEASTNEHTSTENVTWNTPAAISECPSCQEIDIPNFDYLGNFEGHRYYLSKSPKRWSEAQEISLNNDSYLAVITSDKENKFVTELLTETQAYIGLTDIHIEGNLVWANGEEVAYLAFEDDFSEPNARDFAVLHQDGFWTMETNSNRYFLMEKPCVDIELISPLLPNELGSGHYTAEYRYTSICGEEEECLVNINISDESLETYCTMETLNSDFIDNEHRIWIEEIQFENDTYSSGDNEGYGDFSSTLLNVSPGQSLPYHIVPNQSVTDLPYFVQMWIDWNQDGDFFDDHEALSVEAFDADIASQLTIPATASNGLYRLRILLSNRSTVEPCGSFEEGEAEDYTLGVFSPQHIGSNENNRSNTNSIFPNPAKDKTFINLSTAATAGSRIVIYNLVGQKVMEQIIPEDSSTSIPLDLKSAQLEAGMYQVQILIKGHQTQVLPLVVSKNL